MITINHESNSLIVVTNTFTKAEWWYNKDKEGNYLLSVSPLGMLMKFQPPKKIKSEQDIKLAWIQHQLS